MSEYHEWLSRNHGLNLGSLENSGSDEEGFDLLRFTADTGQQSPSTILERSELERLLASAIEKMPKIERTVLSLYFYEDLTLREISAIVNLHESRVSQLKSQAILRLRSFLRKRWDAGIGD
jgi:RNA polymerase sigma factor for flagellar operon FliA